MWETSDQIRMQNPKQIGREGSEAGAGSLQESAECIRWQLLRTSHLVSLASWPSGAVTRRTEFISTFGKASARQLKWNWAGDKRYEREGILEGFVGASHGFWSVLVEHDKSVWGACVYAGPSICSWIFPGMKGLQHPSPWNYGSLKRDIKESWNLI